MSGLADEHSSVLHQLLAVQESEASEQVTDLAFPALQEETRALKVSARRGVQLTLERTAALPA